MIDFSDNKKITFKILKKQYGQIWSDREIHEAMSAMIDAGILLPTDRRGVYRVSSQRIVEIENQYSK